MLKRREIVVCKLEVCFIWLSDNGVISSLPPVVAITSREALETSGHVPESKEVWPLHCLLLFVLHTRRLINA